MVEEARTVVEYFRGNPLAAFAIAFCAGLAATKIVMHQRRAGWIFFLIVGIPGAFLGQLAALHFGVKDLTNQMPQFWLLFDFLIAFAGSFVVAAIVHFVKPL
jgi:uncharacterized membrane protein YeaQ/YmgE (transglycosylase-associated protein family)